jgi:P27 family predicted phage terminase small subunit
MGRYRKPAIVRRLEGNRSGTPIPKEIVAIGTPQPPEHLTAEQLDRWHDIVGSLPAELLTRADMQVLERMSVAWATFRETCGLINRSGFTVRGQNGEQVLNPVLRVRSAATEEMQQCGMLLGLSPLARTRLTAQEKEDADPLTVLLGPQRDARKPN